MNRLSKKDNIEHSEQSLSPEMAISDRNFPSCVETAFVFAARYVHHRNTGGTLAVCRALSYMWPQLSERTREQIVSESHEATTNLHEWRVFRGEEEFDFKDIS